MNPLTQYPIDQWIAIAFLIAIPLPFILILISVRKEANKLILRNTFQIVTTFFILYISYIVLASFMGWFNKVFLPPMVLLLTTFPYAFLLFLFVAKTKAYQKIIHSISLDQLVALHIFRFIGVFFVILALYDALPKTFAFIAGFGDMITAASSIFVAKAIRDRKTYAKKLTLSWNIFGTVDILFTAIAAITLTKISIDSGSMGVDTLATFPFCLIPAFAPPTILFLHWSIFKKIKQHFN